MLALLILLLFTVRISLAQSATAEPESKWWWAWRESTHELIAFDAEGDTNVIATPDSISRFSRISDDIAIAILQRGDEYALYKLTSQSVTPLTVPVKNSFGEKGYVGTIRLIQTQLPYVLISGLEYYEIWIVDLNTNTVEPLDRLLAPGARYGFSIDGIPEGMDSGLRFSADGRYLHYAANSSPFDSDVSFALRERDLTTGMEHNFYVAPSVPDARNIDIRCQSGDYGEQWLCHRYSDYFEPFFYANNADFLVNLAGQTRILVEQSLFELTWDIFFSRDSLIIVDQQCQQNCAIDLYTQNGRYSQTYNLPLDSPAPFDIFDVIPLDNGNLLIQTHSNDYILSAGGQMQKLGTIYCCTGEPTTALSPDLHWILLPTEYGLTLWNLETSQVKAHITSVVSPSITYTDRGVIVNGESGEPKQYLDQIYLTDADTLLEITTNENGSFVDILPNHMLLYEQRLDSADLATGIYRYDTDSKTYTPLVPGATFQFGY